MKREHQQLLKEILDLHGLALHCIINGEYKEDCEKAARKDLEYVSAIVHDGVRTLSKAIGNQMKCD